MKRGLLTLVLAFSLAFVACATPSKAHQQYLGLSPESRELFDKYRQFLSENQENAFLSAATDDERRQQIQDLHIEERLARYPPYIQQAIWSRTPVVGMDKTALFLTLGTPDSVDRRDFDPDTHILPSECWFYRRGTQSSEKYEITIVNDQITEVKVPSVK